MNTKFIQHGRALALCKLLPVDFRARCSLPPVRCVLCLWKGVLTPKTFKRVESVCQVFSPYIKTCLDLKRKASGTSCMTMHTPKRADQGFLGLSDSSSKARTLMGAGHSTISPFSKLRKAFLTFLKVCESTMKQLLQCLVKQHHTDLHSSKLWPKHRSCP